MCIHAYSLAAGPESREEGHFMISQERFEVEGKVSPPPVQLCSARTYVRSYYENVLIIIYKWNALLFL